MKLPCSFQEDYYYKYPEHPSNAEKGIASKITKMAESQESVNSRK